jgi:hypothetical protein
MLKLTPEANALVKRNLFIVIGAFGAFALVLVLLLAVLINPPGSTQGFRVGMLLLVALVLPLLALGGAGFTLAYPFGAWPGMIHASRLRELYGIDPQALSNEAMRARIKTSGYWAAFAKGAGVAFAFVLPWILIQRAISGHFSGGTIFPGLIALINAGGISVRAWVVRGLVEKPETAPVE